MRIVIDLQGAQTESRFRGIGRYSLSITKAIVRNRGEHEIIVALSNLLPDAINDIRNQFVGILPKENIVVWDAIGPVAINARYGDFRRKVGEVLREEFLAKLQPDFILVSSLFEGGVNNALTSIKQFDKHTNVAVILYDLIPFIQKETYLHHDNAYAEHYSQKIKYLKKADILLGISKSSCNEAIKYLEINKNNIFNISSAVDENFTPLHISQQDKQELYNKYKITKKIIVYAPGGFDIRKNFENTIKAYAKLPEDIKNKYQLVIVSKLDDVNRKTFLKIAKNEKLRKNDLILTGYVKDKELISFYNTCDLFIFTSIHEGFGLPVLEAMNCGAVVIGSNTTSIPEVIGHKEALFDPYSVESMRDKLVEVLTDKELQNRLLEHNQKQVKKFSWDKGAKEAIRVMENYSRNKQTSNKSFLTSQKDGCIRKIAEIASVIEFKDNDLIQIAKCIEKNERAINMYALKWRLEGPFDSSYSLALLNRETARALEYLGHYVILQSTEGPGDFVPNESFLHHNIDIRKMYDRVLKYPHESVDVVSRNLYPPRVNDMKGDFNILHSYAWEESGFPQKWIFDFNQHLNGITCLSKHVEKIMIDNGVFLPISTSGCGVDHWERVVSDKNYNLNMNGFKFLHVSSCFPRKGVDIMLDAYGKAFTDDDDVVLFIKTFKNPHNRIHELLEDAQKRITKYPKVIIIEDDLPDEQLKSLYEQCDVLIAPSLAEGFGLPMAEAMLSGLPVVTTNWGGQLDFCTNENSWLIDYEFEKADTHFKLFDSVWAKPYVHELKKALLEAYSMSKEELVEKALKGKELLLRDFKWVDVASRLVNFAYVNKKVLPDNKLKIAWVSSWNTKCGIATYSKFLLNYMKDDFDDLIILANKSDDIIELEAERNVIRCWTDASAVNNDELKIALERNDADIVFFQYNFGFLNLYSLKDIIVNLLKNGKKVYVTFHSVNDVNKEDFQASIGWIKEVLSRINRIFVHSINDLNVLKKFGLVNNVTLLPHGVVKNISLNENMLEINYGIKNKKVIASYGFMLPHKGIKELIEAFYIIKKQMPDVHLLLLNARYPEPLSDEYIEECKLKIHELNLSDSVTMINEFLTDKESLSYLESSELIILPYRQTQESSSASVRWAISINKPVLCTPINIFKDVEDIVYFSQDSSSKAIADKAIALLNDDDLRCSKNSIRLEWIDEHDWAKVSARLSSIIRN
ncbi:glycosyltransferase [Pseudofrancisella aestuarii]|uniref:Glycosyltransferase n=1 Tax=Pseudofrancisella aestuarii TaxID=2670347 RepID=A0ABV9TBX5_9GAMM|nr:glycosyltransferase [Pseudofrancisella aestuarii]